MRPRVETSISLSDKVSNSPTRTSLLQTVDVSYFTMKVCVILCQRIKEIKVLVSTTAGIKSD
jgi:hypothetical protein